MGDNTVPYDVTRDGRIVPGGTYATLADALVAAGWTPPLPSVPAHQVGEPGDSPYAAKCNEGEDADPPPVGDVWPPPGCVPTGGDGRQE